MSSENEKRLGFFKINVFSEVREHLEAWFTVHLQQYNAGASLLMCKAKSQHRIWITRFPVTAEAFIRLHIDTI